MIVVAVALLALAGVAVGVQSPDVKVITGVTLITPSSSAPVPNAVIANLKQAFDAGIPVVMGRDTGFFGVLLAVSTQVEMELMVGWPDASRRASSGDDQRGTHDRARRRAGNDRGR